MGTRKKILSLLLMIVLLLPVRMGIHMWKRQLKRNK